MINVNQIARAPRLVVMPVPSWHDHAVRGAVVVTGTVSGFGNAYGVTAFTTALTRANDVPALAAASTKRTTLPVASIAPSPPV